MQYLIILNVLLYCISYLFAFSNSFTFKLVRNKHSGLFSIGDPNMHSIKYQVDKQLSQFIQFYDNILFQDNDISHITFASPIVWAPWLETIWLGNLYEYRSAYFHDVMYSNNKPFSEGALLFKNNTNNIKLALLYQRYRKFSTYENLRNTEFPKNYYASYSTSNMTLYNIFSIDSNRIGRYKISLSNKLLLYIHKPLTINDMKRYFTTFNLWKIISRSYFQVKRKACLELTVTDSDFLKNCLYYLENDVLRMKDMNKICSKQVLGQFDVHNNMKSLVSWSTNGFQFISKLGNLNKQYFISNFIQSLFELNIIDKSYGILLGSDGRLWSDVLIEETMDILIGNQVKSILLPSQRILTYPLIQQIIQKSHKDINVIIFFTGEDNEDGIQGDHGMTVLIRNEDSGEFKALAKTQWVNIFQYMCHDVNIVNSKSLHNVPWLRQYLDTEDQMNINQRLIDTEILTIPSLVDFYVNTIDSNNDLKESIVVNSLNSYSTTSCLKSINLHPLIQLVNIDVNQGYIPLKKVISNERVANKQLEFVFTNNMRECIVIYGSHILSFRNAVEIINVFYPDTNYHLNTLLLFQRWILLLQQYNFQDILLQCRLKIEKIISSKYIYNISESIGSLSEYFQDSLSLTAGGFIFKPNPSSNVTITYNENSLAFHIETKVPWDIKENDDHNITSSIVKQVIEVSLLFSFENYFLICNNFRIFVWKKC